MESIVNKISDFASALLAPGEKLDLEALESLSDYSRHDADLSRAYQTLSIEKSDKSLWRFIAGCPKEVYELYKKDKNADKTGILYMAVCHKDYDTVSECIDDESINVNAKDDMCTSILALAVSNNDVEMVTLLMQRTDLDVNEDCIFYDFGGYFHFI